MDEDVQAAVAHVLRAAGLDAVSTPEANRISAPDEDQLIWAVGQSRVLVTFNVGDYAGLHKGWMLQGRRHAGIIVSHSEALARRLVDCYPLRMHWTRTQCETALSSSATGESSRSGVEYHSSWV